MPKWRMKYLRVIPEGVTELVLTVLLSDRCAEFAQWAGRGADGLMRLPRVGVTELETRTLYPSILTVFKVENCEIGHVTTISSQL
ncbi:hypothetical protein EVAR_14876_1 [Eumeta japonica]|uniref:Uncharacterized protein n=1 Tax=Eumeta variegata TaxID=151549 RepID=A0A4C1V4N4_EUMVA|nr:hypothetical protein EVAR_14876_1 [Eumeta japonica]